MLFRYISFLIATLLIVSCSENENPLDTNRKSFGDRDTVVVITPLLQPFKTQKQVSLLTGVAAFTNNSLIPYFRRFKEFTSWSYERAGTTFISSNHPQSGQSNIRAWIHSDWLVIQWSENSEQHLYEYLMLNNDTGEWETIDYMEESKDLKHGSFIHFGMVFPEESLEVVERFDWKTEGDTLRMTHSFNELDWTTASYRIHEANGGGIFEFRGMVSGSGDDYLLHTFVKWNPDGTGSWKEFTPEGLAKESGYWPE